MKKIFLVTIFLFQLTFVIGQVKTANKKGYGMATGNYKPNRQETPKSNKSNNPTNNRELKSQNNCYKGFEFTVKNYGYSKLGNHYSWGIKVKNNYPKAVSLRYKLIVGNDNSSNWAKTGTLTYNIEPGATYANDYGTMMALIVPNSSEQYRIDVSDVCFEGQDCIRNGYADCNGKQSKSSTNNNSSIPNKSIQNKAHTGAPANAEEIVYEQVESKPQFNGNWNDYLSKNINGEVANKNGAPEGVYKVIVSFIVNTNGTITDIKCISDPGFGICEEAKRVISQSPNWIPGSQNGTKLRCQYSQALSFSAEY
jgi:Gram-negative bacterial TonB protein C-terminal